jgi:hypothetical protein
MLMSREIHWHLMMDSMSTYVETDSSLVSGGGYNILVDHLHGFVSRYNRGLFYEFHFMGIFIRFGFRHEQNTSWYILEKKMSFVKSNIILLLLFSNKSIDNVDVVLPKAGHWVQVDDLTGLLALLKAYIPNKM